MKLNREKTVAGLALVLFGLGMTEVARGFITPVRGIAVPDTTIPRSTRDNLPRPYRVYTEEGEPSRNPFSFSEGWQRMESTPLALPPLPAAPRPLPLLSPGASAIEARLPWTDKLPSVAREDG
jgi:hypothetical protein